MFTIFQREVILLSKEEQEGSPQEGPFLVGSFDSTIWVAGRANFNLTSVEKAYFKNMTSEEVADMAFELNVWVGIYMALSANTPKAIPSTKELKTTHAGLEKALKANEDLGR